MRAIAIVLIALGLLAALGAYLAGVVLFVTGGFDELEKVQALALVALGAMLLLVLGIASAAGDRSQD